MGVTSVREQLRRAAEEIDSACDEAAAAEVEEYLTGVARLLDHYVEGAVTEPEDHAFPPPGTLDTIQNRITEVMEEAEDPAAAHLQTARAELLEVIMELNERLDESRSPSH